MIDGMASQQLVVLLYIVCPFLLTERNQINPSCLSPLNQLLNSAVHHSDTAQQSNLCKDKTIDT